MDKREKEKQEEGTEEDRKKDGKQTLYWLKRVLAKMPLFKECFQGPFHGMLHVQGGAK